MGMPIEFAIDVRSAQNVVNFGQGMVQHQDSQWFRYPAKTNDRMPGYGLNLNNNLVLNSDAFVLQNQTTPPSFKQINMNYQQMNYEAQEQMSKGNRPLGEKLVNAVSMMAGLFAHNATDLLTIRGANGKSLDVNGNGIMDAQDIEVISKANKSGQAQVLGRTVKDDANTLTHEDIKTYLGLSRLDITI